MKDDGVYLAHIRDAAQRILDYTAAGEDDFRSDTKTQDAVIRGFEIIGEATKRLSPAFVAAHPEIPWKRIAGMRDKLIHDYFGVNLDIVWDTVTGVIPVFVSQVEDLIRVLGDPRG